MTSSPLWIALRLPRLPLDEAERGAEAGTDPLAVIETAGSRQWVHAANKPAWSAGVRPGMAVGAALTLCQGLLLRPRKPAQEQRALAAVADWAMQFSDLICPAPPETVLLEAGGSLELFGGLEPLLARIREGIDQLGYAARLGIAPTALGAELLARAGVGQAAQDPATLAGLLAPLPLPVLGLQEQELSRLHGLGLRSLGDCLRLPRDALARRIGRELTQRLDRALGHAPDPRPRHTPPARFAHTLWLPAEVQQAEALAFAARRLLLLLAGFLRGRGAGVTGFTLRLHHVRRSPCDLDLALVAPSRDPDHLLALLRERLARHTLAAPVEGLELTATHLSPLAQHSRGLFTRPEEAQGEWQRWIERLRARLGSEAVYALTNVADHRPDRAWRRCAPGEQGAAPPLPGRKKKRRGTLPPPAPRPLWLLPEPRPLATLVHQQLAERIESGWWDGAELTGELLCVRLDDGSRAWLHRGAAGEQPQLLGLFG